MENTRSWIKINNHSSNAIYGLGVIGSAIYYIVHATSLSMGIIGIIKAIFWPAVIIYKVMEMLMM